MLPDPRLVKFLQKENCNVAFKSTPEQNYMYLKIDYTKAVKPRPGAGLEIWGNATQVYDKVNRAVISIYPKAEMANQNSQAVTYRIQ